MTGKKVCSEINCEEMQRKMGDYFIEIRNLEYSRYFKDVSLAIGKGEIVGVAGVIGAGKTELAKALYGALPNQHLLKGSVAIEGKVVDIRRQTPRTAKAMGIGFSPEDRKVEGVVSQQPVIFNIILPALRQVSRFFIIINRIAVSKTLEIIRDMHIRPADHRKLVANLSGGNQQKVVIGKWLATNAKLLLLDEPTRGVDVGSRNEIYEVVRQLAKKGMSVIVFSSDLKEIMLLSDRIFVMRKGRIIVECFQHETSEKQLLQLVFEDKE
jgi:ABC-type sugar transport system ATPase subunit